MTSVETKEDLVTVTIDGFEISVPKGTLLIRAAEQLGIQIPRFCDHPLLEPAGACRQCLVDVTDMGNGRGMPKPAASCTTTVMPGMVIKTQHTSAVADKAQQGVMELLLINHPLDCPICDKGGECPLQNQAMSNGRAESRFHEVKRTFPKPIAISSNVLLDRERCVLCQRCTRFSEQIAGDPFIDLLERGANQQIGTSEEQPFQSYFSGNTVQICPVGALTSAAYRFRARPFDLLSTDSICEHCSSGCAQRSDWRRGKITRRLSGEDHEVNEEWNCDKGRWAFHYATQSDRLTVPLVRDPHGSLVPTSWPAALERAATGLREAIDRGGVGVLPGGRLTEEDAYAYSKFARVALGTNDIDFRSRAASAEELAFLGATVAGVTPQHVSYSSLEKAPAVLLAGFEPEEESPIVFLRLRKGTRTGKTRVFSIAPLASRGLYKLDGTLLQTLPGAEAATLDGLDDSIIESLNQPGAVILVGERLATSAGAFTAATALANRTGAALAWVPRRAGELGALDSGALPTLLPGGRPVTDAAARAEVEALWGTAVPSVAGRDVDAILQAAADGSLAALVIGGVDPHDTANPALATEALERAGFIVSLEVRASAVTAYADVVLPVAPAAEKAGRYVTWEGRRRPFDLTITGTGALSDGQVLDALAEELDVVLGLRTVAATRDEIGKLATSSTRVAGPSANPAAVDQPAPGEALLATWAELLDAGRGQDGDEHLAGTAKPARALLSAGTAAALGLSAGDQVSLSTSAGVLVLPAIVDELPDGVVWVPSNARGSAVRATLGAGHGATVSLARAEAPPVVGLEPTGGES
ncbi:NADH-quinone oxidoreductase subunit G [Jatrophihabitans sp.]|uniref:NADH-quinone oxidoreductase subunit G n=1 Tax=Jatrophihabitans sp. TaxID=1932789 RepID=UPI0030C681B2|nr:NADH-quinone oxidoreductase, chain [Jatrophihabitans sp.]